MMVISDCAGMPRQLPMPSDTVSMTSLENLQRSNQDQVSLVYSNKVRSLVYNVRLCFGVTDTAAQRN
jgi:hypothetical protein